MCALLRTEVVRCWQATWCMRKCVPHEAASLERRAAACAAAVVAGVTAARGWNSVITTNFRANAHDDRARDQGCGHGKHGADASKQPDFGIHIAIRRDAALDTVRVAPLVCLHTLLLVDII